MKIKFEKPFMKIPVRYNADKKTIVFYRDGEPFFDTNALYDRESYDYIFYSDVRRFIGMELDLKFKTGEDFVPEFSNTRPKYIHCAEHYRPKVHFTAPEGWLNDPNGLCFLEGKYHIFYQTNPNDRKWDNMTWGHAVSENLVDYTHLDIALFPDETGTMFSGSGFIDENNTLGLNTEHKAMLLYYTAAARQNLISTGKLFEQYLAVSTDGGKTFKRFGDKPIIPHIVAENRDPKIVFCKKSGEYVISLYLENHKNGIFTSKNLVDWTHIFDLSIDGDDECPAFYPLTSPDGSEKWVIQGATDKYIIGSFDGNEFKPETPVGTVGYTRHSGEFGQTVAYAAQGFTQLSGGRTVRFSWIKTLGATDEPYNGCLSIPHEMTLDNISGELKLCANPANEIKALRVGEMVSGELDANDRIELPTVANDITLTFDGASKGITKLAVLGTVYTLDFDKKTVSWTAACGDYYTSKAPLFAIDGKYEIRLITDTLCIEAFFCGGSVYMCANGEFNIDEPDLALKGENPAEFGLYALRQSIVGDDRIGVTE